MACVNGFTPKTGGSEYKLPIELVHQIFVDVKGAYGSSALHGCSIVCRAWNEHPVVRFRILVFTIIDPRQFVRALRMRYVKKPIARTPS